MQLSEVNCPLCGCEDKKEKTRFSSWLKLDGKISVSECKNCSFLFLSPRPTVDEYNNLYQLDEGGITDNFTTQYYEEEQAKHIHRYRTAIEIIRSVFGYGRLSDIGCSSGHFLQLAREEGYEVEGLEPSIRAVEYARVVRGLRVQQGSIESAQLPEASFDIIHSHHVIEHLCEPLRDVQKMLTWLKPGGLFIAEVPNQLRNVHRVRWFLLGYPRQSPDSAYAPAIHHLSFFDPRSFRMLLYKAGLKNIKISCKYYPEFRLHKFPFQLAVLFLSLFLGGGNAIIGYDFKEPLTN